jgi:hypothetical protein
MMGRGPKTEAYIPAPYKIEENGICGRDFERRRCEEVSSKFGICGVNPETFKRFCQQSLCPWMIIPEVEDRSSRFRRRG